MGEMVVSRLKLDVWNIGLLVGGAAGKHSNQGDCIGNHGNLEQQSLHTFSSSMTITLELRAMVNAFVICSSCPGQKVE